MRSSSRFVPSRERSFLPVIRRATGSQSRRGLLFLHLGELRSGKPNVIQHQLAHQVPDALGTAYNRTKFLKERKAMMQQWADYLGMLKVGGAVIPLSGKAA